MAVLCLDLDRFKSVNDSLGHSAGDRLLVAVGERLRTVAVEAHLVARLGGDEFAILVADVTDPAMASGLAQRLVRELGKPYDIDGSTVAIGASIGISVAPGDATDVGILLRNADMALYRGKGEGRGTYRFFEPEMDARMRERRQLEVDLREALAEDRFELHYQPLVLVGSKRIVGFEALIRWNSPIRGMVPPIDFIPLAEETGLIVEIGEWVLGKACAEAASWPCDTKIAVNLSPVQFKSPRLVEAVADALLRSGLPPGRIELEITESVLIRETEAVLDVLHRLKAMGVTISMDDFGTGYSSLGYLRSFPFDKIKIDRSFVRDVATNAEAAAIIRAVTSLGVALGMETVAEGVETEEQFERLREEGCTQVQGYLFSKPRPAGAIPDLLASMNPAPALTLAA
jgi:diguanylate cyclase (GGDEF)-like protein